MTTPIRKGKPLGKQSGALTGPSQSNATMLAAALRLAYSGIPVLPVRLVKVSTWTPAGVAHKTEKRPLLRDWYNKASTDPEKLGRWFGEKPSPNLGVGMVTGYRSGVVVLDSDPRNGGSETLAKLPQVPNTRTHATVSKGRHFLFAHNGPLQSTVLGPGLDLKADNGFIVVPPTPGYEVVNDADLLDFSGWLAGTSASQGWAGFVSVQAQACEESKADGTLTTDSTTPLRGRDSATWIKTVDNPEFYLQATVNYAFSDIAYATPGTRNNKLYRKALYLAGYVAGGHLDEAEVRDTLTEAAHLAGLSDDEIRATLDSAIVAGKHRPIRVEQTQVGRVQ